MRWQKYRLEFVVVHRYRFITDQSAYDCIFAVSNYLTYIFAIANYSTHIDAKIEIKWCQWATVLAIGNNRAFGQQYCPLPSLLPTGIIKSQFWHQFGSKVLPIAITVAHCKCCPLLTPTAVYPPFTLSGISRPWLANVVCF